MKYMAIETAGVKLGGGTTVVCIDECHITRKKKSKAFRGRSSKGQETIIMGGIELDGPFEGLKCAGFLNK